MNDPPIWQTYPEIPKDMWIPIGGEYVVGRFIRWILAQTIYLPPELPGRYPNLDAALQAPWRVIHEMSPFSLTFFKKGNLVALPQDGWQLSALDFK